MASLVGSTTGVGHIDTYPDSGGTPFSDSISTPSAGGGDLLVLGLMSNSLLTITDPAGWTRAPDAGFDYRPYVWYKSAAGGVEGVSLSGSNTNGQVWAWGCSCYRGGSAELLAQSKISLAETTGTWGFMSVPSPYDGIAVNVLEYSGDWPWDQPPAPSGKILPDTAKSFSTAYHEAASAYPMGFEELGFITSDFVVGVYSQWKESSASMNSSFNAYVDSTYFSTLGGGSSVIFQAKTLLFEFSKKSGWGIVV